MAVTRAANVVTMGASGDTVTGNLMIKNIKCSCGTTAGMVTLSIAGTTVYTQQVAANATPVSDPVNIRLTQGQTLTATLTGNTSVELFYK